MALRIDPRYFQILTLTVFLCLQLTSSDFAPSIWIVVTTFLTSILTYCVGWWGVLRRRALPFDPRSSLITALSVSILLKTMVLPLYAVAAIIAVGSKFVLRAGGKHIFNPANLGIVVVFAMFPAHAWVTPGQWGSEALFALFVLSAAFLVLYQLSSRNVSILFLAMWGLLTFGRALWLGDPLAIPFHQLQNGAFLIFTFFMISDPKTVPDHIVPRVLFCAFVAILGFVLQYGFFVREGVFYALAIVCIVRPVLEHFWQATPHSWRSTCIDAGRRT